MIKKNEKPAQRILMDPDNQLGYKAPIRSNKLKSLPQNLSSIFYLGLREKKWNF